MLWGVAGSYEFQARKMFEDMLKEKVAEILPSLKEGETLFDYYLCMGERGVEWKMIVSEKWKVPKEIYFSRLLMPTVDSTRAHILIDLMNQND
jgi:hypothetical protein